MIFDKKNYHFEKIGDILKKYSHLEQNWGNFLSFSHDFPDFEKNCGNFEEKIYFHFEQNWGNFLSFCHDFLTKILSFWEDWRHFEKILLFCENWGHFLYLFLMIFSSKCFLTKPLGKKNPAIWNSSVLAGGVNSSPPVAIRVSIHLWSISQNNMANTWLELSLIIKHTCRQPRYIAPHANKQTAPHSSEISNYNGDISCENNFSTSLIANLT